MKLKAISAFTILAVTIGTQSHATQLVRCNAMGSSGGYQPVLQIIEPNTRTTIFLGESGLNRKIYYTDRRVYAYLRETMGIIFPNHLDEIPHCAGRPNAEGTPSIAPEVTPDPVTPTIETDTPAPVDVVRGIFILKHSIFSS